MRSSPHLIYWLLIISSFPALSRQLPTGLGPSDINHITEVLGTGAAGRLLRSAEPYQLFPGIKLGVEVAFVPPKNLESLGDGNGSIPAVNPAPRIFIAKGLISGMELITSFSATQILGTISTLSGLIKYTYLHEQEQWLCGGIFAGVTHISAYNSNYEGYDVEVGGIFSKDFVVAKPYLGAGVLFIRGSVLPSLAKNSLERSGSGMVVHGFIGTEFETPVNLGAQLDLFNTSLSGSVFVGKKF